MKPFRTIAAIFLLVIVTAACEKESVIPDKSLVDQSSILKGASKKKNGRKATGSVELIWKGASKGGDRGNKPDDLLVFFELDAHEGNYLKAPKGELVYRVLEADATPHREIKAQVFAVRIEMPEKKARILARVISDSKGCSGNDHGGHDSNCSSGGHDDSDGGCSHDDSDGGCSHDDGGEDDGTHDDGGCSHDDGGEDDGTHDEGCSHDDTGDDGGGCSGEDDHDGGAGGSPGGDDKGNPMSGKNCRLGQIIALKVHDKGTPGTNGDGITWKWFSPEAINLPLISDSEWHHLCKKTIIGGNIVVHD